MGVLKFFAGCVIGGTVGAVIGVLLAPRSGEETRKMLAENSTEIYKNTEESVKELQTKANDMMDELQKKGDDLLRKVQDVIKKEQQV